METINSLSKKQVITPKEITKLQTVHDVQISPNGKQVVFVVSSFTKLEGLERTSIWLANTGNGATHQIKTTFKSVQEPRWSPDGKCFAFLSKDTDHMLCFTDPNGALRTVQKLPKGANSIEWSPNGQYISFLCSEPTLKTDIIVAGENEQSTHLFIIEIATGVIHQISQGTIRITRYAWSPDSKQFITSVISKQSNIEQELVLFSLQNKKKQFIAEAHDMTIMLAWSPDGKYVAWCGREHEPDSGQMMVIPIGDGIDSTPRTIFRDFQGSVKWINFLPNGKIIFAALKNLRVGIFSTTKEGSKVETLLEPENIKPGSLGCGSFARFTVSLSRDGKWFATTRSGPKEPGNVVVGELGNSSIRRITNFNPHLEFLEIGETEEISWKTEDGMDIFGLLIKPVDYVPGKMYPTIVEIHGGPRRSWWDTCNLTNSWAQLLASRGYMVLLPNPRGSSGRGADFVRANERDLGGKDLSDVLAGIDEIILRGYADPDRLGIAGWSYGGFLTSWAITQTNRFKAAVMGASIINWISWNGQSSMGASWSNIHWREPLISYKFPEKLIQRSPIHFVQNVKTPTLIMHGENDKKIPSMQSDEFYKALKTLGIPVEYVKYSGEGHVINQAFHQIDLMNRIVSWFERYV